MSTGYLVTGSIKDNLTSTGQQGIDPRSQQIEVSRCRENAISIRLIATVCEPVPNFRALPSKLLDIVQAEGLGGHLIAENRRYRHSALKVSFRGECTSIGFEFAPKIGRLDYVPEKPRNNLLITFRFDLLKYSQQIRCNTANVMKCMRLRDNILYLFSDMVMRKILRNILNHAVQIKKVI